MGSNESLSSVVESSQDVTAKRIVETEALHVQASMTPVRRESSIAPVGQIPCVEDGGTIRHECASTEKEIVVNSGPTSGLIDERRSNQDCRGTSAAVSTPASTAQLLDSHHALKPAPSIGPGWKTFEVERKGSIITKGRVDRYWLSPSGKKFRSGKEIERYQETLKAANGDEDAAWIAAKSSSVVKTLGKRRRDETNSVELPSPHKCRRRTCAQRNKSKADQMVKKRSGSKALKDAKKNEQQQERTGPSLEILPSKGVSVGTSPLVVNGGPVALIVMADPGKVDGRCFLDEFAPGRTMKFSFDITHSSKASSYNPEAEFQLNGGTYTALATRYNEEGSARSSYVWSQKKIACVYYILTKGGGLPEFNLQGELEKVADFKSLAPHQIPARLELLTSPTPSSHPEYIRRVEASCFVTIEENGNEGCGYAPSNYVEDLLGNTTEAKLADSIQIRIFGPNIGIAKGMLVKKASATKIELPRSMVKVPPSRCCEENWVVVVVKDAFPSKKNRSIGNILDPDKKNPSPSASEDLKQNVKLSGMYMKLLQGFGVPGSVLDKYCAAFKRSIGALKHAHLAGVADPTGQLPPGKVFISGYVGDKRGVRRLFGEVHAKVLLSRSPALVPSDAKLLEVVGQKPQKMSSENWKHLCSLGFGIVVFPAPQEGVPSLPYQVAEGDLDGDLYLCVFAPAILTSLEKASNQAKMELQVRLPSITNATPSITDGALSSITKRIATMSIHAKQSVIDLSTDPSCSVSWLFDSQKLFLDLAVMAENNALTGKLYGLCNKKIDEHGFTHHDVRVLSRAYKDSLDSKKHCLTIRLPPELRKEMPSSLWHLLEVEEVDVDGNANDKSPRGVFGFESILSHNKDAKGRYLFQVEWNSGEKTIEPDTFLKEDDPVTFRAYLRSSGLAFTSKYAEWVRSNGSDSDSIDDGDSSSEEETEDDPSFVTVTDQFGNVRRVSAYEAARIERIRRNNKRLASLGLI